MREARQRARIKQFIEEHGSITGKEASDFLGIMSFTKRISEMRRLGEPLTSVWESGENRYGEAVRYKRWYLEQN